MVTLPVMAADNMTLPSGNITLPELPPATDKVNPTDIHFKPPKIDKAVKPKIPDIMSRGAETKG